MKLSSIPEFKAQAIAQKEIQQDKDVLEELIKVQKDIKQIKSLLNKLVKQQGAK